MRFLANENFPGSAVTALADGGHDIISIRTAAPGMSDTDILAWAIREERILLTFDKDFGELARNADLPKACGVILFRMPMPKGSEVGIRLASIITARGDWRNHFSIISSGQLRMRNLRE